MKINDLSPGITITVPRGAVCGLYQGVPSSLIYSKAIDISNAITPSYEESVDNVDVYRYAGLDVGIYHYAASMDGHTSVCQVINYDGRDKQIDVELSIMAGNGYESGFLMMNSPEFIEANLASQKDSFGEKYAYLFNTPQFTRSDDRPGRHQQTTNEEIYDFIRRLNENRENMYVFSLGKTPKYGFDMPLVLFTRDDVSGKTLKEAAKIIRNNGKPTVQYTAQVHSNEPASTEGALAMMLAMTGELGEQVLDSVDVYIVPRINLDGAVEVIRESPTTGEDMNRDYLFMNNKEIRMVTSAYNMFLPEIAVDGHERWTSVCVDGENRCTDMELQVGAGSLNHPEEMTALAMEIAHEAIMLGRDIGLRTHFYQDFASAAGGSAGSSYYGTRNSLSFLVETPGGTTLGGLCMARRTMAQYVMASTAIAYAAANPEKIISTVRGSREKMAKKGAIYDDGDLIVLEHGRAPTGKITAPLIHVPTGRQTNPEAEFIYDEHVVALRTRVRPTAYVIPIGVENASDILKVLGYHDIQHYTIPKGSTVMLCQYVAAEIDFELSEEYAVCFENGAYVFPNTVPSTILNVVMEPDFNSVSKRKMSLFSMGLVSTDEVGRIPIYRYCHDLSNGEITMIEQ